ncbi:hypothetical protein D3C73_1589690 [compost metagenome]
MSVVRINPIPPCCSAILLMPSVRFEPRSAPRAEAPQKDAATRATISMAMPVMAARTAIENIVPIP